MQIQIDTFSSARVLVVGDIMLDRYIWGEVERISPEAPVPVVKTGETSEIMGGAGNVAANLAGLGCQVTLVGLLGDDETGRRLSWLAEDMGITTQLMASEGRPTTTKTRIMAQKQQLFRLDSEVVAPLSKIDEAQLVATCEAAMAKTDALILSDYGKGMMQTEGFCQQLIRMAEASGVSVFVDPKGSDWDRYHGATCITPNTSELELVLGHRLDQGETAVADQVEETRTTYGLSHLLLTRGADGMCLKGEAEAALFIPTEAREVFDVSGAGDTVIATLAASVAAGIPFGAAARLANAAAGIVVGKLGTRPVTIGELKQIESDKKRPDFIKTCDRATAAHKVAQWQENGDEVIFTNGCFDLLHPGHVDILYKARNLGDRLVVGLNSDASVRRLKGERRPILKEEDRGAILSALSSVDLVVIFDEDTPIELIRAVRPDILVKGADYKPHEVVGKEVVESYGGRVALVPLIEGHSTTGIEQRILNQS
ncbi:bifunctional D-glycero-beta-D-manno-heptose-7-phosphate kinase/D-glycero-beta-D-manno-heptose 1-phosphate adenylyltransferase HldE [Desulfoluna sp.]|uniref:bifunctional D-glycero-beta-D-manno-heptose-7-phosphate kinase/D-glycero-beta-D-manno-heptose 1-phosphate adenylyltransferase HldE n=1 Tax=Desulfoluna sp. TaxID=2045199 RepID=UPI00262406A9|nr:bifunctional D-glycero-beta-D-manno-heptose-7-phosphate kinase/D-glycero-beta-D-manno-heptose 1-phosphate adenylyltransferase HldE [Desulfoluna sp.]